MMSAPPPLQKQVHKYRDVGATYEERRYGSEHMEFYRRMRDEELTRVLQAEFGSRPGLEILEVGCGTGPTLEHLATTLTQPHITGADLADEMLDQSRQRIDDRELDVGLVKASCHCLPFDTGTFDVVVATRFIHQFTHADKMRIVEEFDRVTKPGGLIIVEFYGRFFESLQIRFTSLGKRKSKETYLSHYPSAREVREIIAAGFVFRPLRLVGSRVLLSVFGQGFVRRLTRLMRFPVLKAMVDEYFVVRRK